MYVPITLFIKPFLRIPSAYPSHTLRILSRQTTEERAETPNMPAARSSSKQRRSKAHSKKTVTSTNTSTTSLTKKSTWRPTSNLDDEKTTSKDPIYISWLTHLAFIVLVTATIVRFFPSMFPFVMGNSTLNSLSSYYQSTSITIPSMKLGLVEISLLSLIFIWFYTQSSHEGREHEYYFQKTPMFTQSDLISHGLGPMSNQSNGRALYLDTMKRSLLNLMYCESSRPMYFYGSNKEYHLSKGFNLNRRVAGEDMPENAMTMIGLHRLNNIQECIESVSHYFSFTRFNKKTSKKTHSQLCNTLPSPPHSSSSSSSSRY
jgi:hypothetical protein